ncbi:dimethylsulfonioproprionate lyase family protein [Rhodovibrionaceae bacterium A322]
MATRSLALQTFIENLETATRNKLPGTPEAKEITDRVFEVLQCPGAPKAERSAHALPVCRHFTPACQLAQTGPAPIPSLASALADLERSLTWTRRTAPSGQPSDNDDRFYDGHANAIIVGDGGLEERQDVTIGVSLVAPGIDYPRHRHPPEEIYIVLSPGEWWQEGRHFSAKNSGDLIHHEPGVWHAMKSTHLPLLALWCLLH